jgi:hypothetical protein
LGLGKRKNELEFQKYREENIIFKVIAGKNMPLKSTIIGIEYSLYCLPYIK